MRKKARAKPALIFHQRSDGTVYCKNEEIEHFAYAQLRWLDKDYFKTPKPLDPERFVQDYLGVTVQFQRLTSLGDVLGATILEPGSIEILNEEDQKELRPAARGEIYIDTKACYDNDCVVNYTIMHEAWHRQFDMDSSGACLCRGFCLADTVKEIVQDHSKPVKDWREYRADKYSSYILMPKKFVRIKYKEIRAEYSGSRITGGKVRFGWKVIAELADFFTVSKAAMLNRVRELGLISGNVYESMKNYRPQKKTAMNESP